MCLATYMAFFSRRLNLLSFTSAKTPVCSSLQRVVRASVYFSQPLDGNRKDDRTFEPRTKLRQVWMQSYKDDTCSTQTIYLSIYLNRTKRRLENKKLFFLVFNKFQLRRTGRQPFLSCGRHVFWQRIHSVHISSEPAVCRNLRYTVQQLPQALIFLKQFSLALCGLDWVKKSLIT